jgi:hypothetical protein
VVSASPSRTSSGLTALADVRLRILSIVCTWFLPGRLTFFFVADSPSWQPRAREASNDCAGYSSSNLRRRSRRP